MVTRAGALNESSTDPVLSPAADMVQLHEPASAAEQATGKPGKVTSSESVVSRAHVARKASHAPNAPSRKSSKAESAIVEEEGAKPVPYMQLLRYATPLVCPCIVLYCVHVLTRGQDKFMMIFGFLCALIQGAMMPSFVILFGEACDCAAL